MPLNMRGGIKWNLVDLSLPMEPLIQGGGVEMVAREAVPREGWSLGVKFCISVRSVSWTDSLNPSTLKHYGFDVFSVINTSDL